MPRGSKILYIAGREKTYSRTHVLLKALQNSDYELKTIFPPDRSFKHYPSLLKQFWQWRNWPDLVVVGFYGQVLMPFIRLLYHKPILFDVYVATFETMVYDRQKTSPKSAKAWLYWWSDALSMRLANKIILEAQYHIEDYCKMYDLPPKKFERVFLATDDAMIYPKDFAQQNHHKFLVHFHGEFAPFHGVKYIIQAACQLSDKEVEFQIIGTGVTYSQDRSLAFDLGVENIRFIDRVPYGELADYMSRADVCLGVFGDNPRTRRIVTNKVIEALAVRAPLICSKNEPLGELLTHEKSIYFVDPADSSALAKAILKLKEDHNLRQQIAEGGYQVFLKNCTQEVLRRRLKEIIEEMLK